ncbi:ABC transporter permease [Metabacillus sp. 84]|uniref:ABC transporter permease n=1 Tax=unclassified Metabacillus TaxID=2675274 RepID=UPI003CEF6FE4
MRLSDYLKLGGKNFKRNGFKTAAPIVIITMGIIVFNVVAGFFSGITSSMNETVMENDSLKFIEVVSTPDKALKQEDFNELKQIDGVSTSFPKVQAFVGLEYGKNKITTNLIGVDGPALSYMTAGKANSIKDGDIVLNSALADDLKQGDEVNVSYTVKVKEGEGVRESTKGTIQSLYDQFYITNFPDDLSLATIDYVENLNAQFEGLTLEQYRSGLTYDFGTVVVQNVEDVTPVARQIEELGLDTIYSLKSSQSIPMVAQIIMSIGGVIIVLLLIFSGISIASIIGQSLRGRYKEIGIMRAVGYEKSHLIKLFSVEVLFISVLSFAASIILSFLIISGLEYFLNQSEAIDYTFTIDMTIQQVLLSLILILAVSFLASFRPIVKASSATITDIIRGNAS